MTDRSAITTKFLPSLLTEDDKQVLSCSWENCITEGVIEYRTVTRLRQRICELSLRSHPFGIGDISRRYSITNHSQINEKSLLRDSLVQIDVVE